MEEIIKELREVAERCDLDNHYDMNDCAEDVREIAGRLEKVVAENATTSSTCKDSIHRAMVLIAGIEMENPEDPPRLWTALEDAWDALCDALGTDGDASADVAEAKAIGRHFVVRPSGNTAKMREALSDACYAMFNFLKTQNGGYEEMAKALDKAKATLAESPRNVDLHNTKDEAKMAWAIQMYRDRITDLKYGDWLFAEAKGG